MGISTQKRRDAQHKQRTKQRMSDHNVLYSNGPKCDHKSIEGGVKRGLKGQGQEGVLPVWLTLFLQRDKCLVKVKARMRLHHFLDMVIHT